MRDVTKLMRSLSKSQWLETEGRQHHKRSKVEILKKPLWVGQEQLVTGSSSSILNQH